MHDQYTNEDLPPKPWSEQKRDNKNVADIYHFSNDQYPPLFPGITFLMLDPPVLLVSYQLLKIFKKHPKDCHQTIQEPCVDELKPVIPFQLRLR